MCSNIQKIVSLDTAGSMNSKLKQTVSVIAVWSLKIIVIKCTDVLGVYQDF